MLVVAHPGHELRVHGWLERVRPRVFVLTDGSGHGEHSRIEFTSRVLERAGATPGSLYGAVSDRALYSALLSHDVGFFEHLARELTAALDRVKVDYVVGDAGEGVNPAHDVCRPLIQTASSLTRPGFGANGSNLAFSLEGSPEALPNGTGGDAHRLRLTDDELTRKVDAARDYSPLGDDVQRAMRQGGSIAFRTEVLAPVLAGVGLHGAATVSPLYERYGAQQVAAGHYQRVIRYEEHMLPLALRLESIAQGVPSPL